MMDDVVEVHVRWTNRGEESNVVYLFDSIERFAEAVTASASYPNTDYEMCVDGVFDEDSDFNHEAFVRFCHFALDKQTRCVLKERTSIIRAMRSYMFVTSVISPTIEGVPK